MQIACALKEKNKGLKKFKNSILDDFEFKKVIFEIKIPFLDHYEYLEFELSASEIEWVQKLVFENYYKHGLLTATLPNERFYPKGFNKYLSYPIKMKNETLSKEKILQELMFIHYYYAKPDIQIELRAISLHVLCNAIKKIIGILKAKSLDYSLYEDILLFFKNKIETGSEIGILKCIWGAKAFRVRLVSLETKELDLVFSNHDFRTRLYREDLAYYTMDFLKKEYGIDFGFYVFKNSNEFYSDIMSFYAGRNIAFTYKEEDVEKALINGLEMAIIYSPLIRDNLKVDFLESFKSKESRVNNKVQNFLLYMNCRYYITDNFCKNKQFYDEMSDCSFSPYDIFISSFKKAMFYILTKILNENSSLVCNMLRKSMSTGSAEMKDVKLSKKSNLRLVLFNRAYVGSRYRLDVSLEIDWEDLEKVLTKERISEAEIAFLRSLIEREDILSILRATPT